MKETTPELSVLIPCYNEQENIAPFYTQLCKELTKVKGLTYELLYVNDGSRDHTLTEIEKLAKKDNRVRVLTLSRNYGKEVATSAGLQYARGKATVMIDVDGQMPPELIHTFLKKWRQGAEVVVGVRLKNHKEGFIKRYGSKWFYRLFNWITGIQLTPGSTDFALIDHTVREEFCRLTEHNRMTRSLIDWLGFQKEEVTFHANARMAGTATYSISKLVKLAMNSFVSLSLVPLYFSGWAGLVITPLAFLLGVFIIVEQLLMHDPLGLDFTGTAMLGVLIIFLVGLLLISQGLMALYISHIHTETQNRPLFVVDRGKSQRI